MNLAGRTSTPSQLPSPLLFLRSESAFPLRSHYPPARSLQCQGGSSPLLLAHPLLSCLYPAIIALKVTQSLTISLLAFSAFDAQSFDFGTAVALGSGLCWSIQTPIFTLNTELSFIKHCSYMKRVRVRVRDRGNPNPKDFSCRNNAL